MAKGRPLVIDWQESEEQLYQLYTKEKNVVRRQKLQLLWLVRSGNSLREGCRLAGVKERCGQRYVRQYRDGGLENVLARQHGGDRGKQAKYLSAEQETQLKQAADAGELKTVWAGIEWVKQHCGIQYSYEGMRSVYKRIKLNKKVPRKQHVRSDPDAQESWKKGVWLPS